MRTRITIWAFIFFAATFCRAQVTTTTLLGTVSDPHGAVVAGGQVTARNTSTNQTRTLTTNAQGEYRFVFLPLGNYSVEVAATGFRTTVRTDIVLQAGEPARVDVVLAVGQATENVTITETPPSVNTSTVEIGRTIDSTEIANLPLVDRNAYALLDLTPGVQSNNNGVATASTGTSNLILGYPEQRTLINGGVDSGAGSVNYFLDGGTNMTGIRNTGNIMPSPDAIQEFRIQTNSYSAEYGRFNSGVINAITKSGSNGFHGSVYEFIRNTVFNANDWGSKIGVPPLHRNQFGATVGGPIVKNKTFFFFDYAGLRQTTSIFMNNAVVPTALERAGNFSQSKIIPIDPATGKAFTCNGVTGVICPNRIDPVAAKIINTYVPASNVAGNIWQGTLPSPFNSDEVLAKIDHQLNNNHRLTGSYFETGGTNTVKAGGTGNAIPWASQRFKWRQHNLNLSDTWIISDNKVNQVWLTYTRNFGGRLNLPQTSLADLGSSFIAQGTPSLPQITVSGYFTLSNAIGGPVAGTNFYSVRDVYSWMKGRHAVKLGGEVSLDKDIQQTLLNNYGVFSFNSSVTKNALADFEIGIPNSVSQDAPVTGYTNSWNYAFFAQDDYRVLPRLTLNLGLRWDIQTPPTDPLNRATTYIPGVQSTVNPTAPVGQLFYGDSGVERGVIPVRWHHISPRVGFAWDPWGDGKTSVRAAAGVFYGSISGNEWNTLTNFEPFAIRLSFSNTSAKTTATGIPLGASLSNPYTNYVGGAPFPYNGKFVSGGGIFGPSLDFQSPYTYQLNFSVQRQLTKDLSVTAAYVGSLSHDLPFAQDVNYPVLTATATTAGANVLSRRPNPAYGAVLLMQSNQNASYNGLQITASQRFCHHVTFNAFYTYSKTLEGIQLQGSTTQGGAQDMSNLAAERGPADTDQRHVFAASFNYTPDYYHGNNSWLRNTINGWAISPIIKLRSGLPFTVTNNGVDANLDGNGGTDRAQLIGDPHLSDPSAAAWFNIAAFAQNKATTGVKVNGNSPRDFLTGPGYRVVDLAISRTFGLTEKFKLMFRAEGTNVFNFVNLGQPGNAVGTATFGVIRSAQPMRKLQFGLRLTF
jgi:Carboxypeptidase regulatory-like domain/TonB dependent receptor